MKFSEELANLPFSPAEVIQAIERGYEEHTVRVHDVECLVITTDLEQIIVPRGTEFGGFFDEGGWRDVLRDLRTRPWPSERLGGWSHSGFLKGARALVDEKLLVELDHVRPIYFMGHSLGGALALNCAGLLHAHGYNIGGVITLGSPRTFTKGTAKKIKALGFPIWQFSNPGDPVPDVPFRFWRFRHCNEIYTDRKRRGYAISKNHMMRYYREAFGCSPTQRQ